MTGTPVIKEQIISDLEKLHNTSGFSLSEIDCRIIQKISAVDRNTLSLNDLEHERLELWAYYITGMLNRVDKLIRELSDEFVQVKKYRTELNQYKREYANLKSKIDIERLSPPSKFIEELSKLYTSVINLWNEIADSEDDLRSEARKNFVTKVYLPVAIAVGGFYALLVFQMDILSYTLTGKLLGLLITLGVTYSLLKDFIKNPQRAKEEI